MLNRPISDGKLAQIMSHHLRLDLDLLELLPLINPHHAANHLRHHNHVPQMRLDQIRLLVGLRFLLGFSEFLDQAHGLALQAAVEPAPGASVHDIPQLFRGQVEELVEVNAAVGEFAEGALLLEFWVRMSVLWIPSKLLQLCVLCFERERFCSFKALRASSVRGVGLPAASSAF